MSRTKHFLDCHCVSCVNELLRDIETLESENVKLKAALGHTEAALAKWGDDSVGEVKLKAQELLIENAKLKELNAKLIEQVLVLAETIKHLRHDGREIF